MTSELTETEMVTVRRFGFDEPEVTVDWDDLRIVQSARLDLGDSGPIVEAWNGKPQQVRSVQLEYRWVDGAWVSNSHRYHASRINKDGSASRQAGEHYSSTDQWFADIVAEHLPTSTVTVQS